MSRPVALGSAVMLVIAALVPFSACGGSGGGSGVFLYQYCGALQRCCDVVLLPDDRTQCARRLGEATLGQVFDQGKADACLFELEDQRDQPGYCQSPFTFAPACAAVFRPATGAGDGGDGGPGSLAGEGAPCSAADACAAPLACDPASATCVVGAALGEPCAARPCVAGAYCDGSVCRATLGPGEPCTQNVMCASYRCHQLTCVDPAILAFCGGA